MASKHPHRGRNTGDKTVYTSKKTAPAKPAKKFALTKKQGGIAAACLAGLLVVLLFPLALASCNSAPASSQSLSAPSAGAGASASYNPADAELDEAAFVGTILPETEDAGIEYAQTTLFLGDSNTNRMMYYYDITGVMLENCIGVDSMGIGSFCSHACAQFKDKGSLTMAQAVAVLQPQRVVITFGSNNVGMDIGEFTRYYTKALEDIKAAWPYCDIIIGGIFPVDQYRQNTALSMKQIDLMNKALAELAKTEEVKFLNWGEAIRDPNTGYSAYEYTIQDGVHLSRKGMEAIFTYFRTHSYITEDRRPKPLKPIPQRIGVQPGLVEKDPYKVPGPIDWESVASSSSSSAQQVQVVFGAWDETSGAAGGGTLQGGGQSGGSITLSAAVGQSTAAVTAVPNEGYEFAYWTCSVGSIGNPQSPTLNGFVVHDSVAPGQTVQVTAVFRQKAVASSAPASSSAPPVSSSQPISTPPSESPSASPPAASSVAAEEEPPTE